MNRLYRSILLAVICVLFAFLYGITAGASSYHYHIYRSNQCDQIVDKNVPLWNKPYTRNATKLGMSAYLSHNQYLLNSYRRAIPTNRKELAYTQIIKNGRNLGWIQSNALRQPKVYVLPYVYTSQFWPSPVRDACEAASLKMALSVKGRAMHTSLNRMVRRIPRSSSPYRGYTKDPWRWGSGATIYPAALSRVARTYGVRAHRILPKNGTIRTMRYYIMHGDPVVFEGSHRMRDTSSDHVLALLGYKPGYFFYADPESRSNSWWCSGWVNTREFEKVFSRSVSARRAMVVSYR